MLMGKYAIQRKQFLENHAPRMLQAMAENGTLDEHLASVQKYVSEYVSERVSKYECTNEEYRAAQDNGDFQLASSLLHTETLYAEYDAGREWIFVLPEDEEHDDEEYDDEEYDDVVDNYNDLYDLYNDESEE